MFPCLDIIIKLRVISYRHQSYENLPGPGYAQHWEGRPGRLQEHIHHTATLRSGAEMYREGCFGLGSRLTSENFPSPNHCTHRMPETAWRLAVTLWDTTIAGHQEKPLIFPQTSSPIPNSFPS